MNNNNSILKTFFKYSIPSVFAMWIYSLYTMVDGIFIGRYVGPLGLAGVNLTMPLINFVFAVGIMIAVGSSTHMAIKFGSGKIESGNKKFTSALLFLFLFGILITTTVLLFLDKFVIFLGGSGELYYYTKEYLRTSIIFSAFFMSGYAMEVYIRLDGSPIFPMVSVIFGGIINIILDYIFIVHLKFGVRGAALATGVAQITTCIFLLTYILTKSKNLKFVKIDNFFKQIFKFMYTGFSDFLTEVSTGILIFLFNISILKSLGDIGVSAFGIISYISIFITMAMIGFTQGLQPIVSYNLGRRNYTNIEKVLKIAVVTTFLFGFISYLIINIFGYSIVKAFVKEIETIKLTVKALKIYSFSYIIVGINIICAGYLTSIKEVKKAVLITLLRGVFFIYIFITILPMIFGEIGIWLTVPLAELITLIITIFLILKIKLTD